MDYSLSPGEEGFRQEVRQFISENYPPRAHAPFGGILADEEDWDSTRRMRAKLVSRGWLTLSWPKKYGGAEASPLTQLILNEELAYYQVPGRDVFGTGMMGPMLMRWGTDEQKSYHLPRVARGEVQWCQGFSEPGAGSDLAGIQTRAHLEGDEFVVNGSKIWTSYAQHANWIMLLVRTDAQLPRHKGISFLLVDMSSPGITVVPIVNMAGVRHFNQVFFDHVRVPGSNLVGDINRGWYVAMTLLDFERSGIENSATARRILDELTDYARSKGHVGRTIGTGPRIHRLLSDLVIEAEVARLLAYKVAWMQGQGLTPTRESSISKLFGSELLQRVCAAGMAMLGLGGQVQYGSAWAPLDGRIARAWLLSPSCTIPSGTSEIQKGIVARRGLGLPDG